jgi:hypothetical protein
VEESEGCRVHFRTGEIDRGVWTRRGKEGMASVIDGDKGSICFLSLMEITIFSRPSGVMCFSRPLLPVKLSCDNFLCPPRIMSSGSTFGGCRLDRSPSSDVIDSTDADSSGTSLDPGRAPL